MPPGQRCPACDQPWVRKPTSWLAGSTRRWRTLRAKKLAANPVCEKPGCGLLALEVHHVRLESEADRYDWDLLQALCRRHHQIETAAQAAQARTGRQGR